MKAAKGNLPERITKVIKESDEANLLLNYEDGARDLESGKCRIIAECSHVPAMREGDNFCLCWITGYEDSTGAHRIALQECTACAKEPKAKALPKGTRLVWRVSKFIATDRDWKLLAAAEGGWRAITSRGRRIAAEAAAEKN